MSEQPTASGDGSDGHVPAGRVQVRDVPEAARKYKWPPGQSGNPSGRGGLYHECRRLASEASPTAMMRLIELMNAEDERVAYMASVAILDRAGVKPKEYDPGEEQKALARMPLEERKARLAELMDRAQYLIAGSRPSQPNWRSGESSTEEAKRKSG